MSRHIRAQTTPTHASGFHLFTVAMTGHAKDKGVQLPQQVSNMSVLFPLDRRCIDVVIVDTDGDSMLSSEVPGKQNPLVHSDKIPLSRSCSLLLH